MCRMMLTLIIICTQVFNVDAEAVIYIPIILSDVLHARANRVVFEYISIVLLSACCAPSVILQTNKGYDEDFMSEPGLCNNLLT